MAPDDGRSLDRVRADVFSTRYLPYPARSFTSVTTRGRARQNVLSGTAEIVEVERPQITVLDGRYGESFLLPGQYTWTPGVRYRREDQPQKALDLVGPA